MALLWRSGLSIGKAASTVSRSHGPGRRAPAGDEQVLLDGEVGEQLAPLRHQGDPDARPVVGAGSPVMSAPSKRTLPGAARVRAGDACAAAWTCLRRWRRRARRSRPRSP